MHRFKPSHVRDTGRRFAGKLYLKCRRHGRLGVDCAPALQDWILERATISDDAAHAAAPDPAPPEPTQAIPAKPDPVPPAPAEPAPAPPAPGHVPAEKPKGSGFGFFS